MFKLILRPLQILKLSLVICVAQRRMLRFNVLAFVSVEVLTAVPWKSEGNFCVCDVFSIFFLKQGFSVPPAFWLSRSSLALNLLSELLAVHSNSMTVNESGLVISSSSIKAASCCPPKLKP